MDPSEPRTDDDDAARSSQPPPAAPAGTGSGASIARIWLLPAALAIVLVALFLRGKGLDQGRMSPDDGEFLWSAQIHQIDLASGPGAWLEEDREWAADLVRDFSQDEGRSTYPHGYLHQLSTRYAARLGAKAGFGRVAALRLDQAILGALTSILVLLWLRRVAPGEPLVAIAGGGLMAVQLGHVMVSRTGWGQAACTFFLVWMISIAWRMYTEAGERDTRALARGAAGITATSLLAYGFHEMATVYTFVLAVLVVLLFRTGPTGQSVAPWRSRRVAWGLAACIPVGALTVGLLFFSEFARDKWFSSSLDATYGWWQRRELAFGYLLDVVAVPRQISIPVLALALLGLAGALTRDAKWLVWLVAWAVVPTLLLFLRFNFPELARIYLPVDVILVVLAAEGLGLLWTVARGRLGGALADGTAALAVVWCGPRDLVDALRRPWSRPPCPRGPPPLSPRTPIPPAPSTTSPPPCGPPRSQSPSRSPSCGVPSSGSWTSASPLESSSWMPSPEGEPAPRIVVAPRRSMEAGGRMRSEGGPYELAARDRYDHLGLYVLRR